MKGQMGKHSKQPMYSKQYRVLKVFQMTELTETTILAIKGVGKSLSGTKQCVS